MSVTQLTSKQVATVATDANLTGDVTSIGNATTLTNAPVIAKLLTGFASGAGSVTATDSILAAIQKLNGNDGLKAPLISPAFTTPALGVATGTSLAVTGALTSSGTSGIGYATGAGGAVTQITSRTTGVTLSTLSGAITTNTTSLAALAAATFIVTNTLVAIGDVVLVSQRSGATNVKTDVRVTTVAAGSFKITVHNIDAITAEVGAIIINFVVLKAVSA